jgi:hypothetical protein
MRFESSCFENVQFIILKQISKSTGNEGVF